MTPMISELFEEFKQLKTRKQKAEFLEKTNVLIQFL